MKISLFPHILTFAMVFYIARIRRPFQHSIHLAFAVNAIAICMQIHICGWMRITMVWTETELVCWIYRIRFFVVAVVVCWHKTHHGSPFSTHLKCQFLVNSTTWIMIVFVSFVWVAVGLHPTFCYQYTQLSSEVDDFAARCSIHIWSSVFC